MHFSRHNIHFDHIDPLANGLDDDIAAEQREADAIHSFEDTSAEELTAFWQGVVDDIEKDPDWFSFSDD